MITSGVKIKQLKLDPVDVSVLTEVLAASSDACWCMEFKVPVDLTAPDTEVVRQVFENEPYWRLSNEAMAQLYLLPVEQEFNDRPVDEIFPRNNLNEEFVRNLIANGFEVDGAPALDTRYDGMEIYVENDVRAHIENGSLIRMFGIVRDVGKHQRREAELQSQLNNLTMVLEAVPTPVFALSNDSAIVIANEAAEQLFAKKRDVLVGQCVSDVASRLSSNDFVEELENELDTAIKLGFPTTIQVVDPTTNSTWSISTRGANDSITAVITVADFVQGASNDQ